MRLSRPGALRHRAAAAFLAALVCGAGSVAIASAQSAPAADPSATVSLDAAPAASPSPSATAGPPASPPVNTEAAPPAQPARRGPNRRLEHLEIAPTIQYTISSGSDVIPQNGLAAPNALPYDLIRFTGDARYRFNSHLGVQYQRISHTGAAGRQFRGGKASYGGSGYDYEERELATWTFNPFLQYRAGYHYRARVCCPGAGDPNGIPRFLGGFFTDLSYRFGPNTIGGNRSRRRSAGSRTTTA